MADTANAPALGSFADMRRRLHSYASGAAEAARPPAESPEPAPKTAPPPLPQLPAPLEPAAKPSETTGAAFGPELSLSEFWRILRRGKMILAATILCIGGTAAAYIENLPDIYTAKALILVKPPEMQVVRIDNVVSELPADIAAVRSQVEILRSSTLIGDVIDRLELANDPRFAAAPKNAGLLDRIVSSLTAWLPPRVTKSAAENPAHRRAQRIELFLGRLDVEQQSYSRIITVKYGATDPAMAARIANGVADQYIAQQLDTKRALALRATGILTSRMADLRRKVEEAENNVETYREMTGLVEGKGITIASQQISEINSQLVVARAKHAEAEARLNQLEQLMAGQGGIESASNVLQSSLIVSLRQQETLSLRRVSKLSNDFGDRHPRIINAKAELEDIRGKIGREVDKIAKNYRNELGIAQARERSLVRSLEYAKEEVAELNRSDVQLRALIREARANQSLLETFLFRSKETKTQEDFQQPDAVIVSRAEMPVRPTAPRKHMLIGVALLGSILLGLVLIFVVESVDGSFRDVNQIEQHLGLRTLGLIPQIPRRFIGRTSPTDYILARPDSAFSDALSGVRSTVLAQNGVKVPKVVLVASAIQDEGKTAFATAMARQEAGAGQKVLLIDCDLRRPQVHEMMGGAKEPGLVEVLTEELTLEKVIQEDQASGLSFIARGRDIANGSDLLRSYHMQAVLQIARERYDLVVIDSAAVQAISYARILAGSADSTIFLIRWGTTRREVAGNALKQLVHAGAKVKGAVLSQVDMRKQAKYSYGDAGYYYYRRRKNLGA